MKNWLIKDKQALERQMKIRNILRHRNLDPESTTPLHDESEKGLPQVIRKPTLVYLVTVQEYSLSDSLTLCPAFKASRKHVSYVSSSNWNCVGKLAYWPSPRSCSWDISIPLALFHCSMDLPSFFYHGLHCNWGPASNIAIDKYF